MVVVFVVVVVAAAAAAAAVAATVCRPSPLIPLRTDALLAKLVLNHSKFLPMRSGEDVVQQRRLPRAEETREHRHGYLLHQRARLGELGRPPRLRVVVLVQQQGRRARERGGVARWRGLTAARSDGRNKLTSAALRFCELSAILNLLLHSLSPEGSLRRERCHGAPAESLIWRDSDWNRISRKITCSRSKCLNGTFMHDTSARTAHTRSSSRSRVESQISQIKIFVEELL